MILFDRFRQSAPVCIISSTTIPAVFLADEAVRAPSLAHPFDKKRAIFAHPCHEPISTNRSYKIDFHKATMVKSTALKY